MESQLVRAIGLAKAAEKSRARDLLIDVLSEGPEHHGVEVVCVWLCRPGGG